MRHFIIVKWHDRDAMRGKVSAIRELFERTLTIPGVHDVIVHPSSSDRANRHDLMIEIRLDAEALPAYDASEPHHIWKDTYGAAIKHKAIFDCEE